jgi:hypothetical protein
MHLSIISVPREFRRDSKIWLIGRFTRVGLPRREIGSSPSRSIHNYIQRMRIYLYDWRRYRHFLACSQSASGPLAKGSSARRRDTQHGTPRWFILLMTDLLLRIARNAAPASLLLSQTFLTIVTSPQNYHVLFHDISETNQRIVNFLKFSLSRIARNMRKGKTGARSAKTMWR